MSSALDESSDRAGRTATWSLAPPARTRMPPTRKCYACDPSGGVLSRRDRGRASTARGPYCTLASLGWKRVAAPPRKSSFAGLVVGGRMGTLHGDDFSSDPRPPVETQSAWIHAVAIARWPRLSTKLADSMGRAGVGHRGGVGKCRLSAAQSLLNVPMTTYGITRSGWRRVRASRQESSSQKHFTNQETSHGAWAAWWQDPDHRSIGRRTALRRPNTIEQ